MNLEQVLAIALPTISAWIGRGKLEKLLRPILTKVKKKLKDGVLTVEEILDVGIEVALETPEGRAMLRKKILELDKIL